MPAEGQLWPSNNDDDEDGDLHNDCKLGVAYSRVWGSKACPFSLPWTGTIMIIIISIVPTIIIIITIIPHHQVNNYSEVNHQRPLSEPFNV